MNEKVYTFEFTDPSYPMELEIDLAKGFYMTDSSGTPLTKNSNGNYDIASESDVPCIYINEVVEVGEWFFETVIIVTDTNQDGTKMIWRSDGDTSKGHNIPGDGGNPMLIKVEAGPFNIVEDSFSLVNKLVGSLNVSFMGIELCEGGCNSTNKFLKYHEDSFDNIQNVFELSRVTPQGANTNEITWEYTGFSKTFSAGEATPHPDHRVGYEQGATLGTGSGIHEAVIYERDYSSVYPTPWDPDVTYDCDCGDQSKAGYAYVKAVLHRNVCCADGIGDACKDVPVEEKGDLFTLDYYTEGSDQMGNLYSTAVCFAPNSCYKEMNGIDFDNNNDVCDLADTNPMVAINGSAYLEYQDCGEIANNWYNTPTPKASCTVTHTVTPTSTETVTPTQSITVTPTEELTPTPTAPGIGAGIVFPVMECDSTYGTTYESIPITSYFFELNAFTQPFGLSWNRVVGNKSIKLHGACYEEVPDVEGLRGRDYGFAVVIDANGTPKTYFGNNALDDWQQFVWDSLSDHNLLAGWAGVDTNYTTHEDCATCLSVITPTFTATDTASVTASETPTISASESPTETASETPTHTAELTYQTVTSSSTITATETATATTTIGATSTDTPTESASETPTATIPNLGRFTSTETETPTGTETVTPTDTSTDYPSDTITATHTQTSTDTITSTVSETPTETETVTPTTTATGPVETQTTTATDTATPSETSTILATHSASGTSSATITPTETASATGSASETPTASATETLTASSTITATATHTNECTECIMGVTFPEGWTGPNQLAGVWRQAGTHNGKTYWHKNITGSGWSDGYIYWNSGTSKWECSDALYSDTSSGYARFGDLWGSSGFAETGTCPVSGTASSNFDTAAAYGYYWTITTTNCPGATSTATSTVGATSTATDSATTTDSATATDSATVTVGATSTASVGATSTATSTVGATSTDTPTETGHMTVTDSATATDSVTATDSATVTVGATSTASVGATSTATSSVTATSTAVYVTPTSTATGTTTHTPTQTATLTQTPTITDACSQCLDISGFDAIANGTLNGTYTRSASLHYGNPAWTKNTTGTGFNSAWVYYNNANNRWELSYAPYNDNNIGVAWWAYQSSDEICPFSSLASWTNNNASGSGVITANHNCVTATATLTATDSPTVTVGATSTASVGATSTATSSVGATSTATDSPTVTVGATSTASVGATSTATSSVGATSTATGTSTASIGATSTATSTVGATSTDTATATHTKAADTTTVTATQTFTPTPHTECYYTVDAKYIQSAAKYQLGMRSSSPCNTDENDVLTGVNNTTQTWSTWSGGADSAKAKVISDRVGSTDKTSEIKTLDGEQFDDMRHFYFFYHDVDSGIGSSSFNSNEDKITIKNNHPTKNITVYIGGYKGWDSESSTDGDGHKKILAPNAQEVIIGWLGGIDVSNSSNDDENYYKISIEGCPSCEPPTGTFTPTVTASITSTASVNATSTATATASVDATSTATPSIGATSTATATVEATSTATSSVGATSTATATATSPYGGCTDCNCAPPWESGKPYLQGQFVMRMGTCYSCGNVGGCQGDPQFGNGWDVESG